MKMLSIVLLFVGFAVQAQDNDVWFRTDETCIDVEAEFNEVDEMLANGHRHAQFRHYNYTTGETVYLGVGTGTVYPVDEGPIDVSLCDAGLGVWSFQMRLAIPDPENPLILLSWGNWEELQVIHIMEGDQMPDPIVRPNPPSLFAVDGVLARDPPGYGYGVQITRER